MLRTTNPQPSLWEAILPAGILGLPEELARVDALLDDPEFLAPFATHYDPVAGRPSIPIDTYLRIMFLKFRYGLGYLTLGREVQDSISWQQFCRIPLGGQVPHATTLVKLTRRVGPVAVDQLNQALLAKAADQKLLRTGKLRADTTVVAANVEPLWDWWRVRHAPVVRAGVLLPADRLEPDRSVRCIGIPYPRSPGRRRRPTPRLGDADVVTCGPVGCGSC